MFVGSFSSEPNVLTLIVIYRNVNSTRSLSKKQAIINYLKPSIFMNLVGGTPEEQLLGMCETVWEPGMGPDELFECISQVHLFKIPTGYPYSRTRVVKH